LLGRATLAIGAQPSQGFLFTLNDVVVLQGNRAKTRHQTAW
jgi:hypothetical protein